MAPELLECNDNEVLFPGDITKCDVYSLGIVLCCLKNLRVIMGRTYSKEYIIQIKLKENKDDIESLIIDLTEENPLLRPSF